MTEARNKIVEVNGSFYTVVSWLREEEDAPKYTEFVYPTREAAEAEFDLVEEYCDLSGTYSDAHKDAYGFRDRTPFKVNVTLQQKIEFYRTEIERLSAVIARQMEEEEKQERKNVAKFELRLAQTMVLCNCSKQDAMRHIMVAENCNDVRELRYVLNLPFKYFD